MDEADLARRQARLVWSRLRVLPQYAPPTWFPDLLSRFEVATSQRDVHPFAAWLTESSGAYVFLLDQMLELLEKAPGFDSAKLKSVWRFEKDAFTDYFHEIQHAGALVLRGGTVHYPIDQSKPNPDFLGKYRGMDVAFEIATYHEDPKAVRAAKTEIERQRRELKRTLARRKEEPRGAYSFSAVVQAYSSVGDLLGKLKGMKSSRQVRAYNLGVLIYDLSSFGRLRNGDFQQTHDLGRHGTFSGIVWSAFYARKSSTFLTGLHGRPLGGDVCGERLRAGGKFCERGCHFNAALMYWKDGEIGKYVLYVNPKRWLPKSIEDWLVVNYGVDVGLSVLRPDGRWR
jgi:hypothetical protein